MPTNELLEHFEKAIYHQRSLADLKPLLPEHRMNFDPALEASSPVSPSVPLITLQPLQ